MPKIFHSFIVIFLLGSMAIVFARPQINNPLIGSNCTATGSAANPSVAACAAATAGSFSCATNASTGTCQVNTTAVKTTSVIQIQPVAASSGLTCNATADSGLTAPRLASQSAGASFTITLGTFTTTAECFNYILIN